jgi:AraC family transcriptional regulator, ethanolamine operon transcriptional activator
MDMNAFRGLACGTTAPCSIGAEPGGRRLAMYGRSRHIVRSVEAFFQEHIGEPVSIARLSAAAGVSERALRNAFYQVYAISPKRYLRRWRLNLVRNALRSADRQRISVTDVATQHGFSELGRFAGEYKALFGERPSQTLYRARGEKASPLTGVA